jgi:hypothetical protein
VKEAIGGCGSIHRSGNDVRVGWRCVECGGFRWEGDTAQCITVAGEASVGVHAIVTYIPYSVLLHEYG